MTPHIDCATLSRSSDVSISGLIEIALVQFWFALVFVPSFALGEADQLASKAVTQEPHKRFHSNRVWATLFDVPNPCMVTF